MLMIAPPGGMCGAAALARKNMAWMFTSNVRRHSSSLISPKSLKVAWLRGVVDQNVDTAQIFHRPIDDLAAVIRGAKVTRDEHGFAALLRNHAGDLHGIFALVQIGNQDVGAFSGEGYRNGPCRCRCRTRDDRAFTLKPPPILCSWSRHDPGAASSPRSTLA